MSKKIDDKINAITEFLKSQGAKRILLFGSRARGDETSRSDIDIAVDLPATFSKKREIKEVVDSLAGLHKVDLVFIEEANEEILQTIEKEGVVLYERE